ncbi:TRAP transporter large permease [Tistrella mobilis]|uniref:TRAP transporter large permease protein n=1 Tax=Tistrella mobilis (strain KA081020-065) TaxID=1110502 RepID=I3TUD3_TISMK|nr:TRAP transporter large permease [Tistrella mobilis]AFK56371.1 TRAP-T family protein transporter, DctM (12 TMs) subunit [Tistrella mobilis KA081020-065]
MSDVGIGLAGIGLLFLLLAMRVPIGMALVSVSFGGIWYLLGWKVAWSSLGLIPYQFAANWVLSSVPVFLLMGFVCYHAQLTQGLFRAARVWMSGIPGGLAIAAVFGSAGFAAVTGSSIACSAAMGRIAVPEMMRHRYDAQLATGTVAAAGTIGALIPPSILMILYGVIAQVAVTKLFLGGLVAGLLTALGYILVILIRVKLNPALAPQVREDVPLSEKLDALRDTWPVLAIMLGVFGGLFGGLFTPTEAGAVGAFLSCVVAIAKGTFTWKMFRTAAQETLVTTSALLIIGIGASLLSRFLALSGAGDWISTVVIDIGANPYMLLLAVTVMYLILGMFLEPLGMMLLTMPIVLPIIDAAGFSLIWFGVLLTKFLEIGMITPPIGMNVFVIKGVVGNLVTTSQIFRGIMWFLVADLILVLVMVLFPGIIMYLPNMS